MSLPSLSRLLRVPVKSVWPMEASAFTPWLLANADQLGDLLGLDLELSAAEHKVGDFSLDLVGRDAGTDEVVIVENQFGATDHRHLGQLLTYAGGTEPATVVWIAESFRDEHRAALDWLNQRTDSVTRFFGVEVSAVTLEGAPAGLVAPLLEVVAKPNDWGKQVKTASHSTAPSDRQRRYEEFWSAWLDRVAPRHWTNRRGPAQHWMYLPAGSARARYGVSFRSDGLLSELFFRHQDKAINLARFAVLEEKREQLEQAFGEPLVFDALPTRKGCRIAVQRTGGESVDATAQWPEYLAWFEDTQVRLRAAIASVGGVPPLPAAGAVGETDEEEQED
jgi:hypothetical protein